MIKNISTRSTNTRIVTRIAAGLSRYTRLISPVGCMESKFENHTVSHVNNPINGHSNQAILKQGDLLHKVIKSEASHRQIAGAKGSSCSTLGCDAKVMNSVLRFYPVTVQAFYFRCRQTGDEVYPGCKNLRLGFG